ncbi:FecR domain-containing protein [Maribacter sp. MMG018]|uniref:FecR family protein n=1 Tax=Maribacter sp. MMG018 TaxID=2822688 RepID=UPI001B39C5CA|nr:FecR domain-containing protein [Maribacter sp. MMG018]MBQ4913789.1 FecR domain-containing protein [Maribacter sp. MMG018]
MKYINFTVEDFVNDEYFQRWVFEDDYMVNMFWEKWLSEHEEKREDVEKALRLVRLMDFDDDKLSEDDFNGMWQNIVERKTDGQHRIHVPKRSQNKTKHTFLKVAAVFVGLLATGLGLYLIGFFEPKETLVVDDPSQITLKLEDGTLKVLDEDSSRALANGKGEIVVKQEKGALLYEKEEDSSQILKYNELIVPYGKKFEIKLSDGSYVYMNSGSKLRYPVNFLNDMPRNVYLDGEAYFSVEKDEDRPFTVITDEMNTQVYGTEFNVSSYKNEGNTSTVLIEGSVGVYKSNNQEASKPMTIVPGQRAVFENDEIAVDVVNVDKYIAWKEGRLMFEDDRFDLIIKELERHFDVEIENRYPKISNKKYTGSFNSQESLDHILKICQEHTPFIYKVNGDKIIITEKK